jgi:hypothetical protein
VDVIVDFAIAAKPLFEFAWGLEEGAIPKARKRLEESAFI